MSALILVLRLHGVFAAIATAPASSHLLVLNMIIERDSGPSLNAPASNRRGQ